LPPALPENLRAIEDLRAEFAAFLDRAQYVRRYSRFTLSWFVNGFANFQRFLLAGADLPTDQFRFRIHALDAWVAWNTQRGLAAITMNNYWRGVRTFFLDRQATTGAPNPFTGQQTPKARVPAPRARSAQDCAAILYAARNYPWKTELQRELAVAVLATMLYAGLRKGEIFRLANSDVDLEEGTIRIVRGKGRYGGKDRTAFIAPELARILRSYLAARDRVRSDAVTFFVSAFKGRPLSDGSLRDIVRKVSAASGVRFSPHILRHSFVTHLLRSGVPIHVVRDLAGHASFETTLGYTAVFDDDRGREIRKLRFGR
jgi:integrase/recombinase XerD